MPTFRRLTDLHGADFYPTPTWATQALLDNEAFSNCIWEPACGDGAMSKEIEKRGYSVYSTDLFEHGYGVSGVDFLRTLDRYPNVDIVTNPPFKLAEEFVEVGLNKTANKLALLLRLAFLEGAKRGQTIFRYTPPARVWVFSERITFYPKGVTPSGSGTIAYAWFVWDKQNQLGKTELKWLVGYKHAIREQGEEESVS